MSDKLSRIDKIEIYFAPVLQTILTIVPFDSKMEYIRSRLIGNLLYDIPNKKSGFISSKALKALEEKEAFRSHKKDGLTGGKVLSNEHFYSRQKSGNIICKLHDSNLLTKQLLIELLDCFSTIHLVLPTENTILSRIQNHESTYGLHWKDQYEVAGIHLTKDPIAKNTDFKIHDADEILERHLNMRVANLA